MIPGHGHLCDEADVVVYRDMVTILRDRVQDVIKKGMTLDQVKAAKPTLDYDPLYAAGNEAAVDRFVTRRLQQPEQSAKRLTGTERILR